MQELLTEHKGTKAAPTTGAGWEARIELGFARRGPRSVLTHRRQRGPLCVQRPFYPEGGTCHLYLLHPPGGVVGGDRLGIDVRCGAASQTLITTPGAGKFYRTAGPGAVQTQTLRVGGDSALEWLPQENIFFPGARIELHTRVEVEPGGRLLGWEILCLGRPANREPFRDGCLDARLEVYTGDAPLLLERLRIENDRDLRWAAGLRGFPVVATLLATPADGVHLNLARACLTETSQGFSGATLVDDLLVVRHLGPSTEQARRTLIRVWSALRPTLLGREPCPPRIWAT